MKLTKIAFPDIDFSHYKDDVGLAFMEDLNETNSEYVSLFNQTFREHKACFVKCGYCFDYYMR